MDFGRGLDLVFLRDAITLKSALPKLKAAPGSAALAGASNTEAAAMSALLATVRENKMEKRLDEMVNAIGLVTALSCLVSCRKSSARRQKVWRPKAGV